MTTSNTNTMILFCLVDGESTAFPVSASTTTTVGELKDLIKVKKAPRFDDVAADELTLWRVSIPVPPKKDRKEVWLAGVQSKEELDETDDIADVFTEAPPKKTIHIIVQRPAPTAHPSGSPRPRTSPSPPPLEIMDVIRQIQGTLQPRDQVADSDPFLPSAMPWQEPRESMKEAVTTVAANVATYKASQGNPVAKALSSFLVCSGAPGVGKTRFGYELYETLKRRLPEATKQQGVDFSPQYYHMLLDFSQDISLGASDADLDPGLILGLRMAYSHFFRGKYDEGFEEFYLRAAGHKNLFTLNSVIHAIRRDLQLSDRQQQLLIFLHIDEFQKIFEYVWRGIPASIHRDVSLSDAGTSPTERHNLQGLRLFQDMMRMLGRFLLGETFPTMVQTFLSGTARQDVTKAAEPTSYGFQFLRCPPLSMGARYDIMSHFANEARVPHQKWMPKRGFFHLLSASGGLPRALQFVLEEFFGRQLERYGTFERTVREIDMNVDRIFVKVANKLDNAYSITAFAGAHKELVRALIRICILEEPSPRALAPSDKFPTLTLETLERDTHTILEDSPDAYGKVLVRIPFFFLHIYNTAIDEVRNTLGSAFLHDWEESREWRFFERIIAEYEALRTNLLIEDGREEATLGSIYKGALGRAETLDITVKLKGLSVVTAAHQFPKIGGLFVAGQERDWRSGGVVVKNADGASFADVFVYRQGADTVNSGVLCALQAKKVERLSAEALTREHIKNKNAIQAVPEGSTLDSQGIKQARIITILITTADADSALHIFDKTSFPEDCLLIHRGNFAEFFGEAFSVPAAFAATSDHNVNFTTRDDLQKKHKLTDAVVDQVMENMPFRSYDELVAKVPAMASIPRAKMEFMPYEELGRSKKRPRML